MFKYSVTKGRIRRVKTPEGARFFGLPIGSIITPGAIYAAKRRHGDDHRLQAALTHEDNAPDPGTGLAVLGTRGSLTRDYVSAPDMRGAGGMEERARRQKELRDARRRAFSDDHMDTSGGRGGIRRGYGPGAGEYEALKNDMEAAQSHEQVDEITDKATRWHNEHGENGAINAAELADLKNKAAAKKRALSRGVGGRGVQMDSATAQAFSRMSSNLQRGPDRTADIIAAIDSAKHPDDISAYTRGVTNPTPTETRKIDAAIKRWHRNNPGSFIVRNGKTVWRPDKKR